jgi:hypothetical protein
MLNDLVHAMPMFALSLSLSVCLSLSLTLCACTEQSLWFGEGGSIAFMPD